MNRLFLFSLFLAAFSYSTQSLACIAGPLPNDITVSGPSSICASDPNASYSINYSTGIDADPYYIIVIVQGGTVSNIQTFSSIGGVVQGPGSCVPTLTSFNGVPPVTETCRIGHAYQVSPTCRGGITFDVEWFEECDGLDPNFQVVLFWEADVIEVNLPMTFNPNCLAVQEGESLTYNDRGTNSSTINLPLDGLLPTTPNSTTAESVSIFPNPATTSEVTVSLPEGYDNYEVRITDLSGKLVKVIRTGDRQVRINTDELDGTVYMVQTIAGDFSDTQKLILSR